MTIEAIHGANMIRATRSKWARKLSATDYRHLCEVSAGVKPTLRELRANVAQGDCLECKCIYAKVTK